MDLIATLPKDVVALSTMMEGTDDPDMHEYADKMDQTLIYFGKLPLLTETFINRPSLHAFVALCCL
jgi:hypothetical protein